MKKHILIGVAWPYVNGNLHIGHLAGYLLPADITARYFRVTGSEVLMVSGSDCFGTPITLEADKKSVAPEQIVEEYHDKAINLFHNILDLSYDLYTRTDHPNHIKVVQDMFIKMLQGGYIFRDKSKQYYSPTSKRFLPDRYVVGICPYCAFEDARSDQCDNCGKIIGENELKQPRDNLKGKPLELRYSEHYYLDWPKLQPFLERFVNKNGKHWKNWVENETKGWFKGGLKPRSITRDLDWGIPLPKDRIPKDQLIENLENKRIYVWFEAVIGYLSASILWAKENDKNWEKFWYDDRSFKLKHYYFMGKDNLVFHALFWPGQLHAYNEKLHLPDIVSINMFLNFDGKQFSKSRGVSINIEDIVNEYGSDPVRFYLTLIMPEFKDSSFNWTDFKEKVNGVLIANFGNFVQRTLSLGKAENALNFGNLSISPEVRDVILKAYAEVESKIETSNFHEYLSTLLNVSKFGNTLINDRKAWKLKKTNKSEYYQTLFDLYGLILASSYFIGPLLPETQKKLFTQFKVDNNKWPESENILARIEGILRNWEVPKSPQPLFTKIENASQ